MSISTLKRLLLVSAGFGALAACGGASSIPIADPLVGIAADLPADAELDQWLNSIPQSAEEALLRSFTLQAAGRHDDGIREVAALRGDSAWTDVAIALRAAQFRHSAPSFDELAWTEEAEGAHPIARGLRAQLNALIGYREYRYSMAPGLHSGASSGLPESWRSIGPLDSLTTLYYGRPTPVDASDRLPDSVELESGALRTLRARVGAAGVRLPFSTNGRYVAETFFRTTESGQVLLHVSGGDELRVEVDGAVVFDHPPEESYAAQSRWIWLETEPGLHRVRLQMGITRSASTIGLHVTPSGSVRIDCFSAECDGTSASSSAVRATTLSELMVGEALDDLGWLVAADVAVESGASELAYRLLNEMPESPSAVLLYHASRLTDVLYQVAPTQRADLSRTFLEAAEGAWEGASAARLRIARLLIEQELYDGADEILAPLAQERSDDFHVRSAMADLYLERGWHALARQSLERAAVQFPRHCPTIGDLVDQRIARGEPVDTESLPPAFLDCDQVQRAVIEETLLPGGRLEEAAAIARVLASRNPSSRRYAWLAADVLAAAGHQDEARAVWEEYREWTYDVGTAEMWEADLGLSSGDLEDANLSLRQIEAEYPAQVRDGMARAFLAGTEPFAEIRRDGAAAIADYLAEEPTYEAGVVFVLDYGVTRLFEDGSGVDLVHQIVEIRNRDALGDLGETGIPPNAHLLRAAVHKRDGRVLIPDDIAGKDSISMPNLEVGDFIELEWAEEVYGPWANRAVYRTGRFFFQSFDGVFHESTVRYVFPAAFEPDVVLDARNLPAPPVVERTDDTVSYLISVERSIPEVYDGFSIHSAEWLPSARAAHDYDWEDAIVRYTDAIEGLVIETESLAAGAEELVADATSDVEAVRRIFRFVSDDIIDFSAFMTTPASWTWEAGEGEALPLLVAMLRAAGFEPEVLFVRPWEQDWSDSSIPDSLIYDLSAVRVPTSAGDIWLEPDFERYPFNYLRLDAQGCEAVVITGPRRGEFVTTPQWDDAMERSHIRAEIDLDEEGDAEVEIVEGIPLRLAHGFRLYVQSADDLRDVERQLEGGISMTFPGVDDVDLRIDGLDESDGPLEVTYTFTSRGFADRLDGELVFDGDFFARYVANWYAERPEIEHALFVAMPVLEAVEVVMNAPAGWAITDAPEGSSRSFAESFWTRTYEVEGRTVTIGREIHLPIQRVDPASYPEFADFLVELASGDILRVRMAPGED